MTTPTPRTDALDAELGVSDLRIGDAWRYRKLARQLERELASAQESIRILHAEYAKEEERAEANARALAEIREEWAGAECGEPVTAQEAYAIGLCKRMYGIAVAAIAEGKK